MNRRFTRALITLTAPAVLVTPLTSARAATTPALTTRVIVTFAGAPAMTGVTGLDSANATTKAKARSQLSTRTSDLRTEHAHFQQSLTDSGIRAKVSHQFTELINAVAVTTNAAGVAQLRSLPGVSGVYPDVQMHANAIAGKTVRKAHASTSVAKEDINSDVDDDVSQIRAPEVWQTKDPAGKPNAGNGETIAVIDSGVDYNNPDLGGGFGRGYKVVGGHDFMWADDDPMDDNGHGTYIAGIIAGEAAQAGGRTGVAPKANLTAYKVLNQTGFGYESVIIEGLEAAVAPDNPHRADVVNLSLGGTPPDPAHDPLEQACEDAIRSGVVVVAAAGNGQPGRSTITSPASAPDVLAVGASTSGIMLPTLTVTSPVNHKMDADREFLSGNPPAAGEDLDLVDVGDGRSESDYDGVDAVGKAVFVHSTDAVPGNQIWTLAQEHKAAALIFRDTDIFSSSGGQPGPLVAAATGRADDPAKSHIVGLEVNGTDGSDLTGWLAKGPVRVHIGSTDGNDQVAAFSGQGPAQHTYAAKPDLVAPGVEIGSTWLNNQYIDGSGTDIAAAPHAAGAAALLREAHPDWTAQDVASALTGGAKHLPSYSPAVAGAGRLDVAAADHLDLRPTTRTANFGLADLSKSTIHATATVAFTNATSKPETLTVSAQHAPGSVGTVHVTPSTDSIPPGGHLRVQATITGDTPTAATDLSGWLHATAGTSTVTVPYLLAVRPIELHATPDPTSAGAPVYLNSEAELANAPKVTITAPDHHVTTVTATATPGSSGSWQLAMPTGPAGLCHLTAKAPATTGVTLTGHLTVEELGAGHPKDWQSVGPDSIGAGRMAPTSKPGRLYAIPSQTAHAVLFRTDDSGTTWHELRTMPVGDGAPYGVAADPNDPDTVYLALRGDGDGTYNGRILVSHDAGATWTILPFPDDVQPADLSINSTGQDLVVTQEFDKPAVSTDRGQTWTTYPVPEGSAGEARIIGHDLYEAAGTNLYVIRDVDTSPSPMKRVLSTTLPGDYEMRDVTGDAHLTVALSANQVFVSHDLGANWKPTFTGPDDDPFLSSLQLVNGTIYASADNHTWASKDGGTTWTTLPSPMNNTTAETHHFEIAAWPHDNDHLIVNVAGTGIFRTADRGGSYQHIGLPAAEVHSLAVNQNTAGKPQLVVGTDHGLFTAPLPTASKVDQATRDWGITGSESQLGNQVFTLAVDPSNQQKIIRAYSNAQGRLEVYVSEDSGATWERTEHTTSKATPEHLVFNPADPKIVYLTDLDPGHSGVLVSRDGGQSWRQNRTRPVVDAIVPDPHQPNRVWLGGPNGLYRSDDQGETLTQLSSTPVMALAFDPHKPGRLLIGGRGLYTSDDGGKSMQAARSDGTRLNISQLLVTSKGTVYASDVNYFDSAGLPVGGRGVLVSHDSGRNYDNISAGLPDLNVESITSSPDGKWLYAGTGSGSIYRLKAG